ncbi:1452_t:CDS:10 [Ambispora gerdemannii]|uniref:lipoate--protein ligase n=1 Tax=Ambispora gerdemannii TaxID=144530 RepID=A0A9N9B1M4_9GLOM|nr:1452_t:CDS:10 [Ambispora gerdemannii]
MSSVSKQKRMAKKAAKNAAGSTTPTKSAAAPAVNGNTKKGKASNGNVTPLSNSSATSSVENLSTTLDALKLSSERTATGVLGTQLRSRDIKIEQYNLSFFGRVLIENASIDFNFGRRYGLVGANGSGKSTFLQSLAAREVPIPEHIDIYLLNQEAEPTDLNATEYVIQAARNEVIRLEREVEDLLADEDGADDTRLEDLYDRISGLDESTFESRASTLLYGLGFSKEMMRKKTKDMSGGWRMRVALAKALFIRPTLLLLDEPTNHLDLEACVWLEEYLKNYNRILVLVSHSQDFLNGVCTNIINLNHHKKLIYYGGNYDVYVRTRAEQEEIAHIKKFIASAGTYANLVRQAKSKQKIIDKMEAAGLVEKVDPPALFKFKFNNVEKLPPPVLQFDQVSFSYDKKSKTLLYEELDLAIDMDSRVALVGPNGVGKSTLLKLMMGELQPNSGRIARHTNLKLAKYNQHSADQLEMDLSPIQYMRKKFAHLNGDVDFWRSQIGRYGLTGAHQTSAIGTLSDGLKTRLVFAEIVLMTPDIILMDEPTNHLDMESIDSLAQAIKEFTGGVVLVSHDFRLISQVAEQIWLCKDMTVTPWDSTIEDYKKHLAKSCFKFLPKIYGLGPRRYSTTATKNSIVGLEHVLILSSNPNKVIPESELSSKPVLARTRFECFISKIKDPWTNLAFEEWLFRDYMQISSYEKNNKEKSKERDVTFLYLWQNTKCVVIGRNQNPWKECNMRLLRADGIPLVRRKSGGGAVYHDHGNTNYTVVMPRARFTRREHAEIVAKAIPFKLINDRAYHHGTMLIESDLNDIGRYLRAENKQNLISKGVESVRSPVTNLKKYTSASGPFVINHDAFCQVVHDEFLKYYFYAADEEITVIKKNLDLMIIDDQYISNIPKILEYRDELKSWKWTYGQTPEFTHELEREFPWGHVKVFIKSRNGLITAAGLTTSNYEYDFVMNAFEDALDGSKYADHDAIDKVSLSAHELLLNYTVMWEEDRRVNAIRDLAEWLKDVL